MSNLTYYHPNARNTGAAVSFRLALSAEEERGVVVTIAPQISVGDPRATPPTAPRYDWDCPLFARLDLDDICKVLQVLRGETENIDDGSGLFKKSATCTVRTFFTHTVGLLCGYQLEIVESPAKTENGERRARVFFNPSEALCLTIALEDAVKRLAWED